MASGVRIALLDGANQAGNGGQERSPHAPRLAADGQLQGVMNALVLALAMVALPGRLQDVVKFVEFDRFEEVMMGAGTQTFLGLFGIVAGRQDDDADFRPATANLLYQPQSAASRHAQIGDDDWREALFEQFQGLLGGAGYLTGIIPQGGGANENVLRRRFIIDDRDGDGGVCLVKPHQVVPSKTIRGCNG